MAIPSLKEFGDNAKGLARNPLGIIALFIVLVYGFASLVVGLSNNLDSSDRQPIIWFLVIFPVLVLASFTWLVSERHTKLYAPSDYKEDDSFIKASRESYRAAIFLGAATAKRVPAGASPEEIEQETKNLARTIERVNSSGQLQHAKAKTILWVDDRPNNNIFERQSLESVGIHFVLSISTEDALAKIAERQYDAIISDMGRPPDSSAGYALLNTLRISGNNTPFIIYAGSKTPEHVEEARRRGASGTTNRPEELFQMVLNAVGTLKQ
jgi:CheY-like chemotaxis protein